MAYMNQKGANIMIHPVVHRSSVVVQNTGFKQGDLLIHRQNHHPRVKSSFPGPTEVVSGTTCVIAIPDNSLIREILHQRDQKTRTKQTSAVMPVKNRVEIVDFHSVIHSVLFMECSPFYPISFDLRYENKEDSKRGKCLKFVNLDSWRHFQEAPSPDACSRYPFQPRSGCHLDEPVGWLACYQYADFSRPWKRSKTLCGRPSRPPRAQGPAYFWPGPLAENQADCLGENQEGALFRENLTCLHAPWTSCFIGGGNQMIAVLIIDGLLSPFPNAHCCAITMGSHCRCSRMFSSFCTWFLSTLYGRCHSSMIIPSSPW